MKEPTPVDFYTTGWTPPSASATIGNPVELAEALTGVSPFTLVDDDGSRRARRVVLVCNPPVREGDSSDGASKESTSFEDAGRIAPQTVAIELISSSALASGDHPPVRTIAFARSRNAVFQLAQRVRNNLKDQKRAELAGAVAAYAATFVSEDRVEAEGKLRDGSTLAIISTNALELGIDIPDLSFAVLVGYPGQISSFRQRIGRVGRTGEGVAALIVGDDPLQQFLARDPHALQSLLEARAESVVVNASAPEIARRYGLGPAQEELGGIAYEDREFFGDVVDDWLADASGAPAVTHGSTPYWRVAHDAEPYQNLRNPVGGRTYTVQLQNGRELKAIGVLDEVSAPRDAFTPAILTSADGTLYQVKGHDERKAEIYCEGPVEVGFLTRGITVDNVDVITDHHPARAVGPAIAGFGRLAIDRHVFSYKEQHFAGPEVTKQVEQGWPPVAFETDGVYLDLAPVLSATLRGEAAVRALEHVLLSVAPAVVACDPYDLEASSEKTMVYLYDSFGGGIRLAEPAFHRLEEVLRLARDVVASCPCEAGCPSCVMLSRRPDGNAELSKSGALTILEALLV